MKNLFNKLIIFLLITSLPLFALGQEFDLSAQESTQTVVVEPTVTVEPVITIQELVVENKTEDVVEVKEASLPQEPQEPQLNLDFKPINNVQDSTENVSDSDEPSIIPEGIEEYPQDPSIVPEGLQEYPKGPQINPGALNPIEPGPEPKPTDPVPIKPIVQPILPINEFPKAPVLNGLHPVPVPPLQPAPPIEQKPPIQVPIKPRPITNIQPVPPVILVPNGPTNNGNTIPPVVTPTSTEVEEELIGVLRKFRRVVTTPAEIGAPNAPISSETSASTPEPTNPESNLSETNPVQTSTQSVLPPLPQIPTGFFGLADSRPLGLILLVLAAAITVMQLKGKQDSSASKSSKKTKWGS